jgi:putative DNA primase/helicase
MNIPQRKISFNDTVNFSDDDLANRFSKKHASTMRYVDAWNQWLIFNGKVWKPDETLLARDRARQICQMAADGDASRKVIVSAKTIANVEMLARSARDHAATVHQWDTDPWLLNTPNGVIDLRTSQITPHRAADFMTKITGASAGGTCPTWLAFIDRVTGGDSELAAYLQRLAGYGLTGSTREHALFFLYGSGANGKSVYINTLSGVLGDYHQTGAIETFTASTDRHPTELAMLRGARLVTAIETDEGRSWAESKIKSLTGGDPVSARFMRQDFFEFTPQCKLVIAGNHRPSLRSVDEAIRRRFHLVPFAVTIPANERDQNLADKLKAEWPGILQWAIQGCLAWQRVGLSPPAAVMAATALYLDAEDGLGSWLADCCEQDKSAWQASGQLYGSWKTWAETAGEVACTQKRFSQYLEKAGFTAERRHSGRGFVGIRLKEAFQDCDD